MIWKTCFSPAFHPGGFIGIRFWSVTTWTPALVITKWFVQFCHFPCIHEQAFFCKEDFLLLFWYHYLVRVSFLVGGRCWSVIVYNHLMILSILKFSWICPGEALSSQLCYSCTVTLSVIDHFLTCVPLDFLGSPCAVFPALDLSELTFITAGVSLH